MPTAPTRPAHRRSTRPARPGRPPRAVAVRRPTRRTDLATVFVGAYVALLLLIPSQLIVGPVGAPGTPANLWAVAGLVAWAAMSVGGLNPVRGLNPTRIAVFALVLAVLASYANAMVTGWYAPASVRQSTDAVVSTVPATLDQISGAMITAADRGLLSMAGWLGVVLIGAEGIRSWSDLERLVRWLTGLGAVVALIGVLQFATGADLVSWIRLPGLTYNTDLAGIGSRSDLNRVSSTAVHPIELGVVMASLVPLAVHVAIHRWRAKGGRLAAVVVALLLAGALVSVSRTAVLAMVVGLAVLFLGWPRAWRWRALALSPVAFVVAAIAAPGLITALFTLFADAGTDTSVTSRTADYTVVLGLYDDHPLLGRGLFTFLPQYYRVVDNQVLTILIELGALGLLAVLAFLAVAWASARTAYRTAPTARQRHLGLAVSAGLLGGATSLATFDAWAFPMCAGLSFLLAGLAGTTRRLSPPAAPRRPAPVIT